MAWGEANAWLKGSLNEAMYKDLLDDAVTAPARNAGRRKIVHNNCVHQHFNASAREPARALVIKTKPMYLFMNMLFQHTVQKRPKTPSPTQGNFVPRDEEEDFNHAAE